MTLQLRPSDLAAWRASLPDGVAPIVLDVREPWELQTASVRENGFRLVHIPMREVPARLAELQGSGENGLDQPIACLCHHGMRSLQVANYLAQSGFTGVVNLQGGIDAWSAEVDSAVPRY
ncbi:MAG: rhodanese-like domain-containing protein [Polaromonas sp.]|nr:rhodanese-like domain-containing protein [Polaromonas sp.]